MRDSHHDCRTDHRAGLTALFLSDIFLTTFTRERYWTARTTLEPARAGISQWRGRVVRPRRSAALSFAGPVTVVALIVFWAARLTTGAALIIRPELGTAIRPTSGGTPTHLVTALLVAGNSLSIVGGGDYSPHTSATRLLFLIDSLIGYGIDEIDCRPKRSDAAVSPSRPLRANATGEHDIRLMFAGSLCLRFPPEPAKHGSCHLLLMDDLGHCVQVAYGGSLKSIAVSVKYCSGCAIVSSRCQKFSLLCG